MQKAIEGKEILESRVTKCDDDLTLHLSIADGVEGIIPYAEIEYSFNDKPVKGITAISKVGKTIKYIPMSIEKLNDGDAIKYVVQCSRKEAQKDCYENYVSKLTPGDIVQARVTYIENYGVFCDIGCGITALLPVTYISISRILDAKRELKIWKDLHAIVYDINKDKQIILTHRELLGTWEEEVSKFKVGETIPGTVKAIEKFGAFVEISQNLCGLVVNADGLQPYDKVNVYIKSISEDTLKIELVVLSSETPDPNCITKVDYKYSMKKGHLDNWSYSPDGCKKYIGTRFTVE